MPDRFSIWAVCWWTIIVQRKALPYLMEAARISPDDYRVHRQLGKAYTHLDQLEKAGS